MTGKIVVLSSCGSVDEAERLAGQLLEARLAACVSVLGPARSFYRWKGVMENAAEYLLVIKSSAESFERLRAVLEAAHSYETPEVLALPVAAGSAAYLAWLEGELLG